MKITELEYECSYCRKRSKAKKEILEHEKVCPLNRNSRSCYNCDSFSIKPIVVDTNIGKVAIGSVYVCEKHPDGFIGKTAWAQKNRAEVVFDIPNQEHFRGDYEEGRECDAFRRKEA